MSSSPTTPSSSSTSLTIGAATATAATIGITALLGTYLYRKHTNATSQSCIKSSSSSGCPYLASKAKQSSSSSSMTSSSSSSSSSKASSVLPSSVPELPKSTNDLSPLTIEEKNVIKSTVPILASSGLALMKHFYARMIKNNPDLKNQFSATHQLTGAQALALAQAVHAYAANIDDLTPLLPTVKHIVHKHCSIGVTPDQYSIVGENLIASLMEVLTLDHKSPIILAWTRAYNILADIFIKAEYDLYVSTSNAELFGWYGYRDFIITSKIIESENITSYYLSPRDGIYPLPKPEAGQYIAVRVYVKKLNSMQIRQYTITDYNQKYYRISVKKDLGVSLELSSCIVGVSTISVTVPYGEYTLSNSSLSLSKCVSDSNIILISAGIGITPIYSLAMQLSNDKNYNNNNLTFIHGTHNSNTLFHDAINKIKQTNKFNVKLFFSKPDDKQDKINNNYDVKGRIVITDDLLSKKPSTYFVCGPSQFMTDIHKQLINKGVNNNNIHMELFSTGSVPE